MKKISIFNNKILIIFIIIKCITNSLSKIFLQIETLSFDNYKTNGCIKSNNMFSDHLFDCNSFDIIYLEEKIEIKNFEFNLVKNKEENITGILGLGLFDKIGDINKSFLKILKNKGIIKEYNWNYNNKRAQRVN